MKGTAMSDVHDIFERPVGGNPARMNTFLRLNEPKTFEQLERESGCPNGKGHIGALQQEGKVVNAGRGKGYVINEEWFNRQSEAARRTFLASCGLATESIDVGHKAQPTPSGIATPDGAAAEELSQIASHVAETEYFSPGSLKDERERKLTEIVERRGQPDFRRKLIAAYKGSCAVTGFDAVASLEAAHIVPYSGPASDHITNGLLLRADIHTLFDLDLIGINPKTQAVVLAPILNATAYADLDGRKLRPPANSKAAPNQETLSERWEKFCGGSNRKK